MAQSERDINKPVYIPKYEDPTTASAKRPFAANQVARYNDTIDAAQNRKKRTVDYNTAVKRRRN